MGMYTEILVKCEIRGDIDVDDLSALRFLFGGGDEPSSLPGHEFFLSPRWRMVGTCSSYYHIPWSVANFSEGYLFSRSDLKAYDNEDVLLFDWIDGLQNELPGKCIGWRWYEEDDQPTLVVSGHSKTTKRRRSERG